MSLHQTSQSKSKNQTRIQRLNLLRKAIISRVGIAATLMVLLSILAIWIDSEKIESRKPQGIRNVIHILFDRAEPISLIVAVLIFLIEIPDRKKRNQYDAWQVINSAQSQCASGGRIQAIQDLNDAGVSLEGLTVPQADLSRIRLPSGQLSRANFEQAYIDNAELEEADFSYANLKRANLTRANLKKANLSGADLSGADLSFATLHNTNLYKANLKGASLTLTELWESDLFEANFEEVKLCTHNLIQNRLFVLDQNADGKTLKELSADTIRVST